MRNSTQRFPRHVVLGISAILVAIILAGSLALFTWLHVSSHAFAASLQRSVGTTCVQAPTMEHCNNQDPELQGCAADADTIGQANIVENGVTIGRVERRFSHRCDAWGDA